MKWKNKGYLIAISECNDWGSGRESIVVVAKHPEFGVVGTAVFAYNKNIPEIKPGNTIINEDHRRLGLATAMYNFVEDYVGLKLKPADDQSDDAKLFWNSYLKN